MLLQFNVSTFASFTGTMIEWCGHQCRYKRCMLISTRNIHGVCKCYSYERKAHGALYNIPSEVLWFLRASVFAVWWRVGCWRVHVGVEKFERDCR